MEALPLLRGDNEGGRSLFRARLINAASAAAATFAVVLIALSIRPHYYSIMEQGSNVHVDGDTVSIFNPENGMTTVVDTMNGHVRHEAGPKRTSPELDAVTAPTDLPRGEPHTYWTDWEESPAKVHNDLDGLVESPQAADFRRHFKKFKKFIGDDETPEQAAMRIFKIYPSFGGRPDLYPADDHPVPNLAQTHRPKTKSKRK